MRSKRAWVASAAALLSACGGGEPLDARFFAAGTEVSVRIYETAAPEADAALAALEAHLLERSVDWYPWADGELRSVNAAIAAGEPARASAGASDALERIVRRAADIERRSAGRFNAGLGALTELWGFHRVDESPQTIPARADVEALLASRPGLAPFRDGDWSAVSTSTVIDPGGIAKGSLLVESASILRDAGISNAIVNLGGDLLVIGRPPGRNARIGIRSPFDASVALGLTVAAGEAVMTSGNYERYFDVDGVRYHHVLDPATGYPVTHTASVTVLHRDPELADAAATALLVAGPSAFFDVCEALEIEHAVLFSADGDLVLTPALDERLD